MCGRFVQAEKPQVYADHFGVEFIRTETLRENFNVAPTSQVYAVVEHQGDRALTSFRWGLIPSWAKERSIGARTFNARSETAADKPMFRDSFRTRRCIIPMDGFYEWERREKGKLPHYIRAVDGAPLPAAGLWSVWKDPETGGFVRSCTILTGEPNALLEKIHDRMPVIMPSGRWHAWLDPALTDQEAVRQLMAPYSDELMTEYPVSTLVNNARNNTPDLLTPLNLPT